MTEEEKIHIDEEDIAGEETSGQNGREWTEEFKVAGEEMMATIEELIQEATVRRIIIKRNDKVLVEIPLVFGLAGIGASIVMAPVYAALGIVAALALDCSILVVRSEKEPEGEMGETAVAAE
ncbi:MAG: DUF4342 domain-containing protein [Candidatus Promineifilaceae bacterium]